MKRYLLDLGCGNNKTVARSDEVVIGVDVASGSQADVICNLNIFPYPLADNSFDEIVCQDVLEHLDNIIAVMGEIHRIGRPGAIVKIRTPHYSSYYAYNDPTHRRYLGYYAFDHFIRDEKPFESYASVKFCYRKRAIQFPKVWRLLGVSYLANKFPNRWEQLFAFIFRAENLLIELETIK